jgi:hypothetical protein
MAGGIIFTVLTNVAGYTALGLCAVCIACALYYAAEAAEEYPSLTKKILRVSTLSVVAVHILFAFDGFPWYELAVGILSHGVYYSLLASFPWIKLSSPQFIATLVAVVYEHYIWLEFFKEQRFAISFLQLSGFFMVMVWAVPFGFFVSLSINDYTLPSGINGASTTGIGESRGSGKKHSLFKEIADRFVSLWGKVLLKVAPTVGKYR